MCSFNPWLFILSFHSKVQKKFLKIGPIYTQHNKQQHRYFFAIKAILKNSTSIWIFKGITYLPRKSFFERCSLFNRTPESIFLTPSKGTWILLVLSDCLSGISIYKCHHHILHSSTPNHKVGIEKRVGRIDFFLFSFLTALKIIFVSKMDTEI